MCYYLFFTGHIELHDKIKASSSVSKFADFVMFVSSNQAMRQFSHMASDQQIYLFVFFFYIPQFPSLISCPH